MHYGKFAEGRFVARPPNMVCVTTLHCCQFMLDVMLVAIHSVGVSVGLLSKPTLTVTDVGMHSITISITRPEDAVQSTVITYLITYGKAGEIKTKTTTETLVTLDKLEKNTEYLIKVKGKYATGKYGAESDPLHVTTNPGFCSPVPMCPAEWNDDIKPSVTATMHLSSQTFELRNMHVSVQTEL